MSIIKTAYHTICWGGVTGDPVGVTSVKDLLYRSYGDVEKAIDQIAEAGYSGFEVFDGNLMDYEGDLGRLQTVTERADVELLAVYSGGNFIFGETLTEELWRIRRVTALAGQAGATILVVGGGAQRANGSTDDDYAALTEALDQVVDIAAAEGLDAVFHPHLTTIVETPQQVARVLDGSRIGLCADTAHLAAGGGDPAQMIRDHADRLRYVHLKDLTRDPFGFAPLGQGDLDMSGIVAALRDVGYAGWATVELDSYDGEPAEAAQISRKFLTEAGLA